MEQAVQLGWEHIKLYFMAGLPGETYEDLAGIGDIAKAHNGYKLCGQGQKGRQIQSDGERFQFRAEGSYAVSVGCSGYDEMFIEKHNFLSGKLRIKGVTFNYHETGTSRLEAVLARGDRKTGRVLEAAHGLGCRFDSWSDKFRKELWDEAFRMTGTDPDFYSSRERSYDEVLPWDVIDPLIRKEYLIEENERSRRRRPRRIADRAAQDAASTGTRVLQQCDMTEVRDV